MTVTTRTFRRRMSRRWLHRLAKAAWLFVVLIAFVACRSALLWPLVIAAFTAGYAVCSWRIRRRVPRRRGAARSRRSSRPRGSARSARSRRAAAQGS